MTKVLICITLTKIETNLSHPVGLNGQNHIVALTPLTFLPIKEIGKRQKSIEPKNFFALEGSMTKITSDVINSKCKAKELKEKGNAVFKKKKYVEAEKFYSEAIKLNIGSRPLWTNRAACRNTMKKFEEAISDCDIALSIDPKCTRTITEKGKALSGLSRFDEARECYESLRSLGENSLADDLLKKLHDLQERVTVFPKALGWNI